MTFSHPADCTEIVPPAYVQVHVEPLEFNALTFLIFTLATPGVHGPIAGMQVFGVVCVDG
jgi:hypothetical protein